MRTHQLVALALAALALSACKGDRKQETPPAPAAAPPAEKPAEPPLPGEPPPASVSPERRALAEKVLADMEAIAAAGEASQGNCKQAAVAMKAEMDRARPDIARMDAMKDSPDRAAKNWFEKTYGNRMMGVMTKVIGVANRCKADPDFQQAMAGSPFSPQTGR
jgi:hypothetical protein